MGKDSAAGAGRGSGTSEGPRGPQIEDSPPAFYGMHLVLDKAQVTDMRSATVLCDREGNALAAVSGDGMLIEVYNTAGELICRLNRSADLRYVITSAESLVLNGTIKVGDMELKAPVAQPPPVTLTWPTPSGVRESWTVTDEAPLDFTDLTLIQRRTMAVRLRTIASALSGDRR